jgi:hypothetical protein
VADHARSHVGAPARNDEDDYADGFRRVRLTSARRWVLCEQRRADAE